MNFVSNILYMLLLFLLFILGYLSGKEDTYNQVRIVCGNATKVITIEGQKFVCVAKVGE